MYVEVRCVLMRRWGGGGAGGKKFVIISVQLNYVLIFQNNNLPNVFSVTVSSTLQHLPPLASSGSSAHLQQRPAKAIAGEEIPPELGREKDEVATCPVKIGDRVTIRAPIQGEGGACLFAFSCAMVCAVFM